jgi:hypothetical protein
MTGGNADGAVTWALEGPWFSWEAGSERGARIGAPSHAPSGRNGADETAFLGTCRAFFGSASAPATRLLDRLFVVSPDIV